MSVEDFNNPRSVPEAGQAGPPLPALRSDYLARSRSLLNVEDVDAGTARRALFVLLGLAVLAFLFSIALRGDEVIAGVIPSVVLFVAQTVAGARARRTAPG